MGMLMGMRIGSATFEVLPLKRFLELLLGFAPKVIKITFIQFPLVQPRVDSRLRCLRFFLFPVIAY